MDKKIKEPTQLPIMIYENELEDFSKTEDKVSFVREYIKQKERAEEASEVDIWSLFLKAAIASNKVEIVKFILSNFNDSSTVSPVDLLTVEDRCHETVVSVALAFSDTCDPEILQSIICYLQSYSHPYLKTSLDDEALKLLKKIFYYIIHKGDETSQYVSSSYIRKYLEPLYKYGALEELYHTSSPN